MVLKKGSIHEGILRRNLDLVEELGVKRKGM